MSNRKSTRRFCPFKRSNLLLSSSGSSDFPAQLLNQISIQSHRRPLGPCVSCSPSFESPKRFYDVGCPCVIRPLVRQPPTAMASGSKNTDITDAHGFIITDLLFFLFFSFDGPLGLRILNGFSAYQVSPVMWHTSIHITLRLRKIRVDLPRRRRDLCY